MKSFLVLCSWSSGCVSNMVNTGRCGDSSEPAAHVQVLSNGKGTNDLLVHD